MWFNKYKGIISNDGARPLTDLENLFGGMSAGCFSTLGNNPFDVVKTRMQGMDAAKYKNTVDCFRQVRALCIPLSLARAPTSSLSAVYPRACSFLT